MDKVMEMLKTMQDDMRTNQAKTDAKLARMDANMDDNQAELKGAITQIEWKKPASVEMKPEVVHEEVPPEDAARMPVGEPRNRSRDR
jgi:hypothetical protein